MTKKKPNEVKKPDNPKSFSAFLKKRAPVYLGIIGLFMIFAYPALTEKNLGSLLVDESFEGNEKIAVEMVKFYKGSNDTGISVLEAIEEKINDKYPDTGVITDFIHYGAVTSFFGEISTVECFEDNSLVKKKLSEKQKTD